METEKKLKLGVAYHGNRMLNHVKEDMSDIVAHNMNLVVHMFSHTDWDRHHNIMKEIVDISLDAGLEVWIDNWGLGGPPGDKSHFLAYYPDSHIFYSDGSMDPVRACLNSPDFRSFTKAWIDAVYSIGGRSIFWDEPHLPVKEGAYSCCCPKCKKLFEEKFNKTMPSIMTAETEKFRTQTIIDYFREMTEYSSKKGIENIVCVMLSDSIGINLDSIDSICGLPTLSNIGSDPYWYGHEGVNPYEFVYNSTKKNLDVCKKHNKDHNIWIQAYAVPRGREDEIIMATDAAYDAGARTILAWGYYGSISNDYRAENPYLTWKVLGDAMGRIQNRDRDRILANNRKLVTDKI